MAKLLDGSSIPDEALTYDRQASLVYYHGNPFNDYISRAELLRIFPDFDVDRENYRRSNADAKPNETNYGLEPLDTSTGSILIDQVARDGVLAAPLDSLDHAVGQIFKSSGVWAILIVGGLVLGAYVYLRER